MKKYHIFFNEETKKSLSSTNSLELMGAPGSYSLNPGSLLELIFKLEGVNFKEYVESTEPTSFGSHVCTLREGKEFPSRVKESAERYLKIDPLNTTPIEKDHFRE